MCGRIGYTISREELLRTYPWLHEAPESPARYNVAPTDPVVVVGPREAREVSWGLDGRKGSLFNLRAETALKAGRYRSLLAGARVLVPASHFYEWRLAGSRRLPVAVRRRDDAPLNLAGLLGRGEGAPAATILTTAANPDLESLHDRMPVVLSDDDAAAWVLEELGLEQMRDLLRPCPAGVLELRPASPLVNDVKNDGPELLDPAALPRRYQLDLIS
jgi:putative SOS response-associated peptidase YedK